MAKLMVDTWLEAHADQIPRHLWESRRTDWTYAISERGWRRTITDIASGATPNDLILLACDDQTLAGLASCSAADGLSRVSLGALYVAPPYQQRGIGRSLLGEVLTRYAALGAGSIQLGVLAANKPAQKFYEAVGGKLSGQRTFNEQGEQLPELVYTWELMRGNDE